MDLGIDCSMGNIACIYKCMSCDEVIKCVLHQDTGNIAVRGRTRRELPHPLSHMTVACADMSLPGCNKECGR